MEDQVEKALGDFNPHVVHHRDELTKRVVRVNAYRLLVHKGTRYFEWPKGSGNLFYEDRTQAGRLNDNGDPIVGTPHIAFEAPLTEEERINRGTIMLEQENKRLMAELTSIKKEQEADVMIAKEAASNVTIKRTVAPKQEVPKEVKIAPKAK